MSEKGLVGELGLGLEPYPVSGLTVLHFMLQDHDFKHFLGLRVREFALGEEVSDMGSQGVDAIIGELADIREHFVPEAPEMLLGLLS